MFRGVGRPALLWFLWSAQGQGRRRGIEAAGAREAAHPSDPLPFRVGSGAFVDAKSLKTPSTNRLPRQLWTKGIARTDRSKSVFKQRSDVRFVCLPPALLRHRAPRPPFADGIGYHDDGEYDVGALHAEKGSVPPAGAAAAAGSKKKKSLAAAALKKARKNKAAAAANAAAGKGGTMWDFVNKGLAGPEAGRVQGGGKRKGGGGKERDGRGKGGDELDDELDDMIDAMDDAPEPSRSRGRSIGGRRSIGSRGGRPESSRKRRAYGSREPVRGGRASSASGRRRRSREHRSGEPTTERYREDEDEDVDFGGDGRDVDFGGDDDGADVFGNHDDDDEEEEKVAEDAPEAKDAEMEEAEEEDGVRDDEKPELPSVTQEPVAGEGKPAKKEEEAEAAVPVEAPRPRPGRLAGRLAGKKKEAEEKRAAEAKKAEEAMKLAERKEAEKKAKEAAAIAAKGDDKKGGANGIALDASSASFQLANIAAAGAVRDGGSKDLARIVRTEEPAEAMEVEGEEEEEKPEPRSYVDLFWLDAHERNGVVSLYGKVKVPVDGKGKGKDKGKDKSEEAFVYQSCCVVVPGNERNLFVLPRVLPKDGDDDEEDEGEDGERQRRAIGDVYDEMRSVLQPSCIPHAQGAAWKAKPVTRSYAFEDPSIPRGECQYLKVVYDGKYPVPDRRVCVNGGETFEKILGAGATNLENFLVKRRLMGPGWVRIYDPQPVAGGDVSWCKWECVAEGPKAVKRLDLATTPSGTKPVVPPAPPVSVVSLKFKTVVHPKTDQLEILCASAVCHDRVLLDAASDESERRMTQLTVVRPLDVDGAGAAARFPRDMEKEVKAGMPGLQKSPNERALLSRLFAQIGNWDPDVVASHNGWGHDIDLLLSRCVEHKVHFWSKIGRRKQMKLPSSSQFGYGRSWAVEQALEGRVLCDTLLSAKEFLSKETTYALTNLAKTQLKVDRQEIEQVDVPQWTRTGEHFVRLARHTLNDARLVQGLMFKLQALPLTKQLTNIAGNLWSRTLKGNRAERNEYLLLHEFHALKYVVPEKRTKKQREEETAGGGGDEGGAGGGSGSKNKPKYSGGLVLEPKKGLYDSFILLLDFNSLYPSLIQEYNLCFTTMEWAKGAGAAADGEEGGATPRGDDLPPLPDESLERGVLPRVIKTLVDRRRNVKKLMKNEKDGDKKEEVRQRSVEGRRVRNFSHTASLHPHFLSFLPIGQLNIRQMALKLTANSMYGCLGFSHSRFYAQPIAALVTAMGRETLQRTVDLAQTEIGLDVIYGDTDSIMIDTRIADLKDYPKVLELGNKVKREVNKLYRTLELEIDGVFRSMLLLKKKKYAAVNIAEGPDGEFVTDTEMKGLDLVRRNWCIQSKRGELPLEKYVISKGLNKNPNA
ncbi:hypothetical protein ACHAWF_017956 [Thalassiosira exigua]